MSSALKSTNDDGKSSEKISKSSVSNPKASQLTLSKVSLLYKQEAANVPDAVIDVPLYKKVKRKYNYGKKIKDNMRVKLPPIESYQQVVKFPAEASGRVILRLERLMGSANIQPIDPKYMKTLRTNLEAEETTKWRGRHNGRKQAENERCRQLIIDGHAPAVPGTDICKHPVFRVNRIINRLSNMEYDSHPEFTVVPPPIHPCEPFLEFEETGYLFGFHPGHHKKVKKETLLQTIYDKSKEYFFHPPVFDSDGNLLERQSESALGGSDDEGEEEEDKDEEEEEDKEEEEEEDKDKDKEEEEEEDEEEVVEIGYEGKKRSNTSSVDFDSIFPVSTSGNVTPKLGIHEIEAAKQRYGIDVESIEDMWKRYETPLLRMLDTAQEATYERFDFSVKVLETFNREQLVVDNFINKTYRQLLPTL